MTLTFAARAAEPGLDSGMIGLRGDVERDMAEVR